MLMMLLSDILSPVSGQLTCSLKLNCLDHITWTRMAKSAVLKSRYVLSPLSVKLLLKCGEISPLISSIFLFQKIHKKRLWMAKTNLFLEFIVSHNRHHWEPT